VEISPTGETKVACFARVALPHLEEAYRLARWLLRDEQDAQDAVQEAFATACQRAETRRGDNPRGWILAIVRNTCYSVLRKRKAYGAGQAFDENSHSLDTAGLSVGQPDNNPETLLLERIDRECVRNAVQRLPIKLREVLVLREIADLSYAQIARTADIPIGTVMSRLARARELLAGWLKEQRETT
jgi:RNA polymerase sigma-70 factor, ECF subfamily